MRSKGINTSYVVKSMNLMKIEAREDLVLESLTAPVEAIIKTVPARSGNTVLTLSTGSTRTNTVKSMFYKHVKMFG